MIIYLIRHGQRTPNRSERQEIVKLTTKGVEQAHAVGRFLREHPVDLALASPKWRTIDTAICATPLHLRPIQVWPCLVEYDLYGPMDYVPESLTPACQFEPLRSLPEHTPGEKSKDCPESFPEAFRRAHFALQCLKHLRLKRLAVFSHKVFNSLLIWSWLGAYGLREKDCYPQEDGCINILETGKPPVINFTGHLGDGQPHNVDLDLDLIAAVLLQTLSV